VLDLDCEQRCPPSGASPRAHPLTGTASYWSPLSGPDIGLFGALKCEPIGGM
jgi:hypothetical protein